jgi:signal transduction histidine kinase
VVVPDIAMPILQAMARLHPDKDFALDATNCEGLVLPLDPVDYAEVLSILLDNAGKWSRKHVSLSFACDKGATCTARIADDGPGIPAHLIDEAFVVGTRFDPDAAGSGLGLPIAQDLCEGMGVELTLTNGSKGLVAELRYPASSIEQV